MSGPRAVAQAGAAGMPARKPAAISRAGLLRILFIIAVVGLLEVASRLAWIDPVSFIPPSAMAAAALRLLTTGEYARDMWLTLQSAGLAVLLAAIAGMAFGLLLHALPRLRRVLDPLLLSYYAVPIFVLYPMLIVLFGLNRWPLVAIGFLFAVVAMAVNTLNGLERIPAVLMRTGRGLRMGWAARVRRIMLPACLPYLLTGLKLTVVYAFIAVIAGEFVLSGAGFGYRIAFAYNNFDNPAMYGLMLILLLFVGGLNMTLHPFEHRLYRKRGLA
jgi:NitT/TauT family transport system permease protein